MTWVKICGTTNLEDAHMAIEAGADALGFIFASSARRVDPDLVREIVADLPRPVETVGVFVNQPVEHVCEVAQYAQLTTIQLHGDETTEYVRDLRTQAKVGMRIVKAVPVLAKFGEAMRSFAEQGGVDAVLLDTASYVRGGTGETWDWIDVAQFLPRTVGVRFIVAGGLSPENVADAVKVLGPWGVDVVTGVEREPGKKDPGKVKAFVDAVRKADGRASIKYKVPGTK
ncbi:MAG TPA: phosphoribosylanthranilate isomerase [Terriglobales bacterium]|nr:phosphoribosylanthranilate isomerase [Terriglobales bacterium]